MKSKTQKSTPSAKIDAGLPPMRVVAQSTLEQLGRLPRSNEGIQVDALAGMQKRGSAVLFFSHRWKRPNWCEQRGKDLPFGTEERQAAQADDGLIVGDPDDADHSKAKALIAFGKWLKRKCCWEPELSNYVPDGGDDTCVALPRDIELFWWIDWACTDQDNLEADMAALPAFAAACAGIVAADNKEYEQRAWCRVELLMAYAFMPSGDNVYVLEERFDMSPAANSTADKHMRMRFKTMPLADPLSGKLSNEGDIPVIQSLTDVARRSAELFSCFGFLADYFCSYESTCDCFSHVVLMVFLPWQLC